MVTNHISSLQRDTHAHSNYHFEDLMYSTQSMTNRHIHQCALIRHCIQTVVAPTYVGGEVWSGVWGWVEG